MLQLEILPQSLTVCKAEGLAGFSMDGLYFIGSTDKELSLVCETDRVPAHTLAREDGWRALRVVGQLDFARLDYSYFDAYAPEAQLVFEPFLISDYEHFERILAGEGVAKVEAKMETYGIKVLDYVTAGFRCITSKDKITKLADCKNYLLRSPGTQIYLDTFNMMGFKPVVIAYNEVYNALQSGLANGCDNSVTTINDQEIYKITPYVCKLDHMMSFTEYCVNTDWWAKLPDAYKQVIEECMTARCSAQRSGHKAVQQAYYDNMAKNGATITEWDDRQELYDLFSDYWQNFADGLGGDAPALLAEIRKLK